MGTFKFKIDGKWVKIPTVQGKRGEKGEKGDKGDKGDTGIQGEQGIQGIQGEKGDAPEKGIDYWTDADKQDIKKYCDEQIGIIETLLKEV